MRTALATCCLLLAGVPAWAASSVPFTINTSEPVAVITSGGTPRIAVDVGGITRYATYSAGTGTSALTFTYTMVAGDVDLDGVTLSSPIQLNGGIIKDLNGNDAALTFTVPDTSSVKINYPSLSMDFVSDSDGQYALNGTTYSDLTSFLTAAGATFSRSSVGTYFDSSGVMQTASSGTPRFDYVPATHAAKGILIEESRTNSVTNSQAAGAVLGALGSGGILPTNWSSQLAVLSGTGTINATILATGTTDGMNYIDIRFNGTINSGTGIADVAFGNLVPTTAGATWTLSAYAAVIGGSLTNIGTSCPKLKYNNSGGGYIGESANCTGTSSSSLGRVIRTVTTPANTASFSYRYAMYIAPGTFDVTMRYAAPQAELGSFVTSYIPTTAGTTVTRAADILTIPTGSWYNASTTTLSSEYSSNAISGYSTRIASLNEATSLNVYQLADASAGIILAQKAIGGSILNSSGPTYVAGTNYKIAGAMDNTSSPLAVNNTLYSNTNAGLPSGITRLQVGSQNGSSFLNGWIKKLKYYPSRVTNTQLQLLTQ